MNESEEKPKFKVNDHRRFDDDGNQKEGAVTENQKAESKTEAADFTMEDPVDPNNIQINFASFIASLGTQALMQLGEIPSPEGMEIPQDPQAAKQTIDIIEMLKEKTAGNLEQEESYFLEEMLHNLRIAFLKEK